MSAPFVTPAPGPRLDALGELEQLSLAAGQPELSAEIRRVGAGLGRRELTVAVLGQFKRGKSSLLNALAGCPALPTGVLPTTAVATYVVRGPRGLRVVGADGGAIDAPLTSVARYVSEKENPGNMLGVSRVEVSVPMPEWATGVTFVDSPGVGSANDANTAAARRLLPEVDAALFVLSPDPPITADELAFLGEAKRHAAKFFFVVNKIDLLADGQREELLDYLARLLRERCGFGEVRLYRTSARNAARLAGEELPSDGSDLRELAHDLREFLGARRDDALGQVTRARTVRFALRLRAQIELAERAARLSQEERRRRLGAVEARAAELRREHRAFRALLEQDVDALIAELPERIDGSWRPMGPPIVEALNERLDSLDAWTAGGLSAAFDREFREAVRPAVSRMRLTVASQAATDLQKLTRRLGERLQGWSDQLRSVVRDEFGVDLPPLPVEAEPLGASRSSDRIDPLSEGSLVAQTIMILPAGALRRRLRGRLAETVEAELDAQGGRLRSDLAGSLTQAWHQTRDRLDRQLSRDLALVEEALRGGRTAESALLAGSEPWQERMQGVLVRTGEIARAAGAEAGP